MPVYPHPSPNPLINIYCPRYDEPAKNVILKDEHFPSDLPGFGVNVVPSWSNEIGYVKHGSRGKQPCISGDTEKLMTSGKQPSISGDTVKIISFFSPVIHTALILLRFAMLYTSILILIVPVLSVLRANMWVVKNIVKQNRKPSPKIFRMQNHHPMTLMLR
ncbi:hypothetical protein DVH24_006101 [Malus domestica]|uniref:Uncharacterized protein n=1 Tax=Malus domestica TaxID=3750 RepID=A0A498J5Q2_MALDO|nr:hypothetical protein DVH24_006101 [Malus domestica]